MESLHSFEKILIAVDDSKYAKHAAAFGFNLANSLKAKIALVHVDEIPVAINITGDPILGDPNYIIPDLIEIQKKRAAELFKSLKLEFGADMVIQEYILDGDASQQIVKIAQEFEASMIVLGTHGRTGFDHFISGSVAESVSRHATCPVLIVPKKD